MDTNSILGKQYVPRLLDKQLEKSLKIMGAVVIEGPRACGKTMTATNACKSAIFLDDPNTFMLVNADNKVALRGEAPRLIDEWQVWPDIWNLVRREVDKSHNSGRFILTGSAIPADDATRHTGAGRFTRLRQHTLTWFERGLTSQNTVSLSQLFEGETPDYSADTLEYSQIVENLCCSGFPAFADKDAKTSMAFSYSYLREIANSDLGMLTPLRYSPRLIMHLLRSLARGTASPMTIKTVTADLQAIHPSANPNTVSTYLDILRRIFILNDQPAWTTSLRSRARLRTSPKLHLADPSLAARLLSSSVESLYEDPNTVGFLFESAVIHDLTVMVQAMGGNVYHYRDSNNHEIDAVIELDDGRWAAIEVKLSGHQFKAGAQSLSKATEQITSKPAFRLVVTGTGPTLTLPDGTITCPLSSLVP